MIQMPPNMLGFPEMQHTGNVAAAPDKSMPPYRSWQCAKCEVFGQERGPCWNCGAEGPLLIWNRAPTLSQYHRFSPEPVVASHQPAVIEADDNAFFALCRRIEEELGEEV